MLRLSLLLIIACGPTADATYAGQQASCVDRYSTRAEINACRERVDLAWCGGDSGALPCVVEAGHD